MDNTIETQLSHRSIREFTDREVAADTLATLFEVAMRTSTSRGFQHAGLIRIRDSKIKEALACIGNQPYIARAPELIVAVADTRRSVRILEEKGADPTPAKSMDAFREGFTDAVLMLQNMSVAAESMGLGATLLGSILNNIPELIKTLKLPQFTFPVLGIMLGYPAQEPQLKPRIPARLRVMEDVYQEPDSWIDTLTGYDKQMTTYYDTRDMNQRSDTFTDQVVRKLHTTPVKDAFFEYVIAQGFGSRLK
ncbi:NADPH-dependent oxidoreductase [Arcanobacterium phocae]|uniref:NADPH-dependent oxidoreductase n=1 Tax=Arcanobacterium phocae TaxID=131112 RepID=UPI001C0EEEE1|nr:NADPH-dependent oxidoreductase [Arcanobacterium phocae]